MVNIPADARACSLARHDDHITRPDRCFAALHNRNFAGEKSLPSGKIADPNPKGL
jgi:hypothetical protein